MFILGLCPRISSSSRIFGASWQEFLGVLRTATIFLPLSLSVFLCPPLICEISVVIHPPSADLGRPFVDHASRYLSACLIQRLPQLAVSYSKQGDTIQGSFLH